MNSVKSGWCRTVETFLLALGGSTDVQSASVDETCRERFGHNTCDARSPACGLLHLHCNGSQGTALLYLECEPTYVDVNQESSQDLAWFVCLPLLSGRRIALPSITEPGREIPQSEIPSGSAGGYTAPD